MKVYVPSSDSIASNYVAYCIEFPINNFIQFHTFRKWCCDNWGLSCEFNFWIRNQEINNSWAWSTSNQACVLYVKSEELLFMLIMACGK